jgi:hypothetical protein
MSSSANNKILLIIFLKKSEFSIIYQSNLNKTNPTSEGTNKGNVYVIYLCIYKRERDVKNEMWDFT